MMNYIDEPVFSVLRLAVSSPDHGGRSPLPGMSPLLPHPPRQHGRHPRHPAHRGQAPDRRRDRFWVGAFGGGQRQREEPVAGAGEDGIEHEPSPIAKFIVAVQFVHHSVIHHALVDAIVSQCISFFSMRKIIITLIFPMITIFLFLYLNFRDLLLQWKWQKCHSCLMKCQKNTHTQQHP